MKKSLPSSKISYIAKKVKVCEDLLPQKFIPLAASPEVPSQPKLLLTHWNLNGINAKLKNSEQHFLNYLESKPFDIICFNETKLTSETFEKLNISKNDLWGKNFNQYWAFSTAKKGYSGTAILSKVRPISVETKIGIDGFDSEGRVLALEFETFFLVAVYVPNSGAKLERLKARVEEWDVQFRRFLGVLKEKKAVVVVGDLNVAHKPIDLKNPEKNKFVAGFTDQERKSFEDFLADGFVDVWREENPEAVKFTFWSEKSNARAYNNGWRIDYCLVNREARRLIDNVEIRDDIYGSDHCPVEVTISQAEPIPDELQKEENKKVGSSDAEIKTEAKSPREIAE